MVEADVRIGDVVIVTRCTHPYFRRAAFVVAIVRTERRTDLVLSFWDGWIEGFPAAYVSVIGGQHEDGNSDNRG